VRKLVLLDRDIDQLRARFGAENPARALVGGDLRDARAKVSRIRDSALALLVI